MTGYRRVSIPGGIHFFTVVTQGRRPLLTEPGNMARLREGFRRVRAAHPFHIDALVILPDHLHAIWRLPEGDGNYALRWRKIKHYFSIGQDAAADRASLERRREKGVWQRRFWEHAIRNEEDWRRHMDYVHYNPVKHEYVPSPGDWPYSSFAKAVERGLYRPDWGKEPPVTLAEAEGEWGE